MDPLRAFEREREREGEVSEVMSCRETVEILTRNPKKGVYFYFIFAIRAIASTFTCSIPPIFTLRSAGLLTPPLIVSYDVTKDGLKVAVLTFTKSAYRLGETVLGIVEINERDGRGKVVSVGIPSLSTELWLNHTHCTAKRNTRDERIATRIPRAPHQRWQGTHATHPRRAPRIFHGEHVTHVIFARHTE